ncbi:MAG TPA: hypothetical protein VHG08_23900 [Longimicrobium sp.]|nr:hypothetical protein [Longimicrobium sp.]
MRIQPTLHRCVLVLPLAGALFGLAPAAASQSLVTTVGEPIAYRVDLPAGAEISRDGPFLAAETPKHIVLVAAADLVAEAEYQLPVSDPEARRILTSVFMDSDSLLLGLMDEGMRRRNVELVGVVREIRTLGGQRAAYLRGGVGRRGTDGWMEMHVTVKDGIMYLLIVGGMGRAGARDETLAARIRDSFVLPDAPPPAASGPARSAYGLRGSSSSR